VAADKYTQLWTQADQMLSRSNPRGAAEKAKDAIKLEPERPEAHFVLGNALAKTARHAQASLSYLAAMEHYKSGGMGWAHAACQAWDAREHAVSCASGGSFSMKATIFCECETCAELPEKPDWMSSPEELAAMSNLVILAAPDSAVSWNMHAGAHLAIGDHATASKSYMRAGQLSRGGTPASSKCLVSLTTVVKDSVTNCVPA
jgi:cytochrome c-type biogenesis protein CcmH/NrfG